MIRPAASASEVTTATQEPYRIVGRAFRQRVGRTFTVPPRVVFVGGSRGTSPSLDLTFPPIGLSENLGGMERGRGGKGEREGWGRPPALLPPTGFCLKYHPGAAILYFAALNISATSRAVASNKGDSCYTSDPNEQPPCLPWHDGHEYRRRLRSTPAPVL